MLKQREFAESMFWEAPIGITGWCDVFGKATSEPREGTITMCSNRMGCATGEGGHPAIPSPRLRRYAVTSRRGSLCFQSRG